MAPPPAPVADGAAAAEGSEEGACGAEGGAHVLAVDATAVPVDFAAAAAALQVPLSDITAGLHNADVPSTPPLVMAEVAGGAVLPCVLVDVPVVVVPHGDDEEEAEESTATTTLEEPLAQDGVLESHRTVVEMDELEHKEDAVLFFSFDEELGGFGEISAAATSKITIQQQEQNSRPSDGYLIAIPPSPATLVGAAAAASFDGSSVFEPGGEQSAVGSYDASFALMLPHETEDTTTADLRWGEDRPWTAMGGIATLDVPGKHVESVSVALDAVSQSLEVVVTTYTPVVYWFLLAAALIGGGSIGNVAKVYGDVNVYLTLVWRSIGMALCITPVVLYIATNALLHNEPFLPSRRGVVLGVECSLLYVAYCAPFFLSLSYTNVTHAFVLNNVIPPQLLLWRLLVRHQPVSASEAAGCACAVLGVAVVVMAHGDGASLFGDLIALVGAAGGAAYFEVSKDARANLNIWHFALLIHAVILPVWVAAAFALSAADVRPTMSFDPTTGIFGGLAPTRIATTAIFTIGTVVGSIGYVACLKAVNATAVSSVVLLEPVVGTIVAYFLHQEPPPAWTTLVGFAFVILGTALILAGSSLVTRTRTWLMPLALRDPHHALARWCAWRCPPSSL